LDDGGDGGIFGCGTVGVAGDCASEESFGGWIARIVLDEVGVALAVGTNELLNDGEAGALGIFVFAVAGFGAVGDDLFDVPFVGVEKETDEGLFVIGVTAGIGFDDEAEAVGWRGRGYGGGNGKEEN
jgi:hypothetical protein